MKSGGGLPAVCKGAQHPRAIAKAGIPKRRPVFRQLTRAAVVSDAVIYLCFDSKGDVLSAVVNSQASGLLVARGPLFIDTCESAILPVTAVRWASEDVLIAGLPEIREALERAALD
jgi:hypothetical protein